MTIWQWIWAHKARAYREDNRVALEMHQVFDSAFDLYDKDPDAALERLQAARQLAQALNDAWWVQLINHWEIQVRLHYKRDATDLLAMATQCAVEVRTPQFADFPQRVCLHEDLITTYTVLDAYGYRDLIQNALDYMEANVAPTMDCWHCLHGLKSDFALDLGQLDKAQIETWKYAEVTEGNDHHQSGAFLTLARLSYRQGDTKRCAEMAARAETIARRARKADDLFEAQAWQAVGHQGQGDQAAAWEHYRTATANAARYGATPSSSYFEALLAFHRDAGRLTEALGVCERHLDTLKGRSRTFRESRVRLEIVRLRAQLGLPLNEALAEARTAAAALRDPSPVLAELDRLESAS